MTALIVDDEANICILIRKIVDWEAIGIEVVGEYMDGDDAYRAIKQKKPDIVIADIKMSGMSGLEIVKKCSEKRIKVAFLLISGHAEFEYARMAIEYNVENYLLKPINKEELESNLIQIKKRLDSEKQKNQSKIRMQKNITKSKEVLREEFLKNLLFVPDWYKKLNKDAIKRDYSLSFKHSSYRLLTLKPICKMQFTNEQNRILIEQITKYCEDRLNHGCYTIIHKPVEMKIYMLINYSNSIDFEHLIRDFFENLKARFFQYCDLSLGMSRETNNLMQISKHEADYALRQTLNEGNNRVYDYEKLPQNLVKLPADSIIDEFSSYIEIVNIERIKNLFSNLSSYISDRATDLDSFIELIHRITEKFVKALCQLYNREVEDGIIYKEMDSIITYGQTKRDIVRKIERLICERLKEYKDSELSRETNFVREAKEYVGNHLEENIALKDICDVLCMNPSYFSSQFKKYTNQNFTEYLALKRVERAKELLKENRLSISQIGERFGYHNARNFSKLFRKIVGIKPSEYRKTCFIREE